MVHFFDADIAKKYGVNAAVLACFLRDCIEQKSTESPQLHEGKAWVRCSVQMMTGFSPFLSYDEIRYALKLVNLDGYEHANIVDLSGGQQQRVAIARAVVNEPRVLLLDEPLSALDRKLRRSMQLELIKIKEELGITFVFVTHDQEEALSMSDTVVVMNQGYIQQIGTPESIYNEPENAFVADFIGDSNIVDGLMVHDKLVRIADYDFDCVDVGFGTNRPVDVQIRPEDMELQPPRDGGFNGVVTKTIFEGMTYNLTIQARGIEWLVKSTKHYQPGDEVSLWVDPFNIQIMNKPESEDERAMEND